MIFRRLMTRLRPTSPDASLYASIVAAARQRRLYSEWRVPDSTEGRFEMMAAHMAVTLHILAGIGPEGAARARSLNEVFIEDMDDNMREIGVGDLTVPRKIKKAAAAVFDRFRVLEDIRRADGLEAQALAAEALVGREFENADTVNRSDLGYYFIAYVQALSALDRDALLSPQAAVPLLAEGCPVRRAGQ